jgi:hypothetical protein
VNISHRGQISPLGARGEVKNGPQLPTYIYHLSLPLSPILMLFTFCVTR